MSKNLLSIKSDILIASNNNGKVKEIKQLLDDYSFNIISASNYDYPEPIEDAPNFEGNALIKAKYYAEKTGKISLSDDSGLCVPSLGGLPGIYSARYAKENDGFENAMDVLLNEVDQIFSSKRENEKIDQAKDLCSFENVGSREKPTAVFVCAICLYFPNGEYFITKGEVEGYLAKSQKGKNGFGYDPIFVSPKYNITFSEMLPSLKDKISHRFIAFEKIRTVINELCDNHTKKSPPKSKQNGN